MREHSNKTPEDIAKVIATTGVRRLSVLRDKSLSSFAAAALAAIRAQAADAFEGVDAIITVTQTHDLRLPSLSTQLQGQLGAPASTFCIDVVDGCSGFIKATVLADLLMKAGRRKVLVVAGDINTSVTEQADIATRILFGDGLAFSVFEASGEAFDSVLLNDGAHGSHILCRSAEAVMQMNGFEVFRFTRNAVPGLVKDYLARRALAHDAFGLVAWHQASLLIVKTLASTTGLANLRGGDFLCGDIGNLGAGSIGAWLAGNREIPLGQPLRTLAIGYGAGLSWGLSDFHVHINRHNEVLHVDH
jgi:3-oxoacyl-[acyl-carrier-protein] synthase-3